MMKILLSTAAALSLLVNSLPVRAADLPAPVYKAAAAPLAHNWTGCYVGIEGGGAWGKSKATATGSVIPSDNGLPITNNFDLHGGLFGGTIGCNYQVSNWVFGVEDDFSWTNKKGTAFDLPPFTAGTMSETNEKWIDTLRGRVGFVWNQALFYGTGGVAFTRAGVNVCTAGGTCVSDSQTRTGWTAGGGVEYAIWQNLSVKLEYIHADFGTGRFLDPVIIVPGVGRFVTRDVTITDDIVRAGLNYRFNF